MVALRNRIKVYEASVKMRCIKNKLGQTISFNFVRVSRQIGQKKYGRYSLIVF